MNWWLAILAVLGCGGGHFVLIAAFTNSKDKFREAAAWFFSSAAFSTLSGFSVAFLGLLGTSLDSILWLFFLIFFTEAAAFFSLGINTFKEFLKELDELEENVDVTLDKGIRVERETRNRSLDEDYKRTRTKGRYFPYD